MKNFFLSLFKNHPLPFLALHILHVLNDGYQAAFFIGNFIGKSALGRFVDRFGNARVFIIAEILMALFIFLLANSTAFVIIIICSVILGIFTKGTMPVSQTMISEAADHHGNFEKAFGANEVFVNIAKTIAPVLLGVISDQLGIVSAFNVMAIVVLLAIIPAFAFHLSRGSTTK